MIVMDVIVERIGLYDTHLAVALGGAHRLSIAVDRQTDRYRRVVVSFRLGNSGRTPAVLLSPTYLDLQTGDVLTPEDVARETSPRMHAHTLHGSDRRRMEIERRRR